MHVCDLTVVLGCVLTRVGPDCGSVQPLYRLTPCVSTCKDMPLVTAETQTLKQQSHSKGFKVLEEPGLTGQLREICWVSGSNDAAHHQPHKHTHTQTAHVLTVHGAPLWLRGGRRCAAIGHSEVGGQGVWWTQGHPPHVFGPELFSPWWGPAEVLILILEDGEGWLPREVKKKGVWFDTQHFKT